MAAHVDKQQTYLRYIDEFVRLSSAPMMLEVRPKTEIEMGYR